MEKSLDALLGLQAHGSHTSKAYVQSKQKFDAICGHDSNPSLLLESIAGLITVTSSPAGSLYYYIKEAQMVLSDWCYPSVDSSWYVGVDTHYNPRVLLEEADFAQDSFRLLDKQVPHCLREYIVMYQHVLCFDDPMPC